MENGFGNWEKYAEVGGKHAGLGLVIRHYSQPLLDCLEMKQELPGCFIFSYKRGWNSWGRNLSRDCLITFSEGERV